MKCTYHDRNTGEDFCIVVNGFCPMTYGSGELANSEPGNSCGGGGGWF
jgi:hypothetical protein